MRQKLIGVIVAVFAFTSVGWFTQVSAQQVFEPLSSQQYQSQLNQIETEVTQSEQSLRDSGSRSCQLSANYLRGLHRKAGVTLDYRVNNYQVIFDEANQLAAEREANDLQTTELRAAVAELSDRVTDFTTNYSQYRAEVLEASNVACNEQAELRATVSRALSALRTSEFHAERVNDYAQVDVSDLLQNLEDSDEQE